MFWSAGCSLLRAESFSCSLDAVGVSIIDGLELISGPGYNTEKAAAVINSGWALYPVNPSKHFYAKMALNLLEKIASQGKLSGQQRSDSRKRTWSSSSQSDQSGSGGGGVTTRGGGHNNAGGTSSGGRQTTRSQQWNEGGRRDSFRSAHSGSSDGGGMYDRRNSSGRSVRDYGDGGGGYDDGYRG
jgi:hypothetical protein